MPDLIRPATFAVVAGEAPHVKVLDAAPRVCRGCAGWLSENGRVAKIGQPISGPEAVRPAERVLRGCNTSQRNW